MGSHRPGREILCTTGSKAATPPYPCPRHGREAPDNTVSLHHRWLLFEEKLDIGAGRWSAPHVPTLALPSLQKLRGLLAEGIVLLDCPARSLLELVGRKTSHFLGIS